MLFLIHWFGGICKMAESEKEFCIKTTHFRFHFILQHIDFKWWKKIHPLHFSLYKISETLPASEISGKKNSDSGWYLDDGWLEWRACIPIIIYNPFTLHFPPKDPYLYWPKRTSVLSFHTLSFLVFENTVLVPLKASHSNPMKNVFFTWLL